MQYLRSSLKTALLVALICSQQALAAEPVDKNDINAWNPDDTGQNINWNVPSQDQYLKVSPSANIWGYIGKHFVAKGQGMWPFGGDGLESIFYGMADIAGGENKKLGYSLGIGAGYRKIFDGCYILGGYIIPDLNRSPYAHNFWTLNPGFEALTEVWDFRVNGYLHFGGNSWNGEDVYPLNGNLLRQGEVVFSTREEAGTGIDGEVGRRIPIKHLEGLKIFFGGYYFGMDKTKSLSGITGRIFLPLSAHTAFEIRDSYDSVRRNICQFGLRINLGGFDNNEKDSLGVITRLTDPVEHNFANFASGNTVPMNAEYIEKE